MAKHEKGARVVAEVDGKKVRGRVSAVGNRSRRIVTDDGKRVEAPVRGMKTASDQALILEAGLDRSLSSQRKYASMFQTMLHAYDVKATCERVHTREDLKQFLKRYAKVGVRFIHLIGHGKLVCGSPKFFTTFEEMDLADETILAEIFGGLSGHIIILDACDLGDAPGMLKKIKKAANAAAVITYRKCVDDWYTNLAGVMLYERFINTSLSPKAAVEKVNDALAALGARIDDVKARKLVVCV